MKIKRSKNNKSLMKSYKRKRIAQLLLLFVLLLAYLLYSWIPNENVKLYAITSYIPMNWINDSEYIPYLYENSTYVKDPGGDVSPGSSDITSGIDAGYGNLPSVYIASATDQNNNRHLFFRLRVKGDPYDRKGGFTSTAYLVQVWNSATGKQLFTVGLDGKQTTTDYVYLTNAAGDIEPVKVYKTYLGAAE